MGRCCFRSAAQWMFCDYGAGFLPPCPPNISVSTGTGLHHKPAPEQERFMDKKGISRRDLMGAAAVAAGALGLRPAKAAEKAGAPDIKLGLYSITYLGLWYRGDALTPQQVVDRAKQFGYQGVELDGKRPHGDPLDMNSYMCGELRRYAEGQGIEIYAVAGNNDFSS